MNGYEMKEKQVKRGGSKVFENWKTKGVTTEDFLNGLKWVCEDPGEDFTVGKRMTRELACTENGKLVRLKRANDNMGCFLGFYDIETDMLRCSLPSINCNDSI